MHTYIVSLAVERETYCPWNQEQVNALNADDAITAARQIAMLRYPDAVTIHLRGVHEAA